MSKEEGKGVRNGVVVLGGGDGKGGGKWENIMLHDKLEPYTKVQVYHTTLF